jgi:hypothetical protein
MGPLIASFFTDECSIKLNLSHYLTDRITAVADIFSEYSTFPVRIMVWGEIAGNIKTPLIEWKAQ